MAEVLAIVAGSVNIVQLAGQITRSVMKIKSYWDQVEDAPDDIKRLLRETDIFNLILGHMQSDQSRDVMSDVSFGVTA